MKFQLIGDGDKLEIRLVLIWNTLKALLKAILAIIITIAAFLSAPEIVHLVQQIGQ